jgi:predicted nucleic acid-binding protein
MKLYLDTCSLQRPLDTRNQLRIILEAEAVLGLIGFCETGQLELVASEVLEFEVRQNPQAMRRDFGIEVLARAGLFVGLNEGIEARAREFNQLGLRPLDALHLAAAEEAGADYFCTCDDRLLKKAKAIGNLRTKVVSPLELIEEIE